MMMLVLVSAALMSPCAANPVRSLNLDHIIDLADQYNKTMYEVRAHLISASVFLTLSLNIL